MYIQNEKFISPSSVIISVFPAI